MQRRLYAPGVETALHPILSCARGRAAPSPRCVSICFNFIHPVLATKSITYRVINIPHKYSDVYQKLFDKHFISAKT